MDVGESSSSSILSTEISLDNHCCCLQSGHNHFLLGLFLIASNLNETFPICIVC